MSNTGGPAFPTYLNLTQGMTLRDYFASKILPNVFEEYCNGIFRKGFEDGWRDDCAKEAYLIADSMLKARN